MADNEEEYDQSLVPNEEVLTGEVLVSEAAAAAADRNLWNGVDRRDAAAVQQALRSGANVNCIRYLEDENTNTTPLMEACLNGYTEIASILLDAGADARWNVRTGSSVMHKACEEGLVAFVEMLIDHDNGLLEIENDFYGDTPLSLAIDSGHADIVRLLMDRGANVHAVHDGQTTLMNACQQGGSLEIVGLLLAAGVEVEARDKSRQTALHHAVGGRNLDAVLFLLRQGACVHVTDSDGLTILMTACQTGSLEVVRLLLALGLDLEARDSLQQTALYHAAEGGEFRVVHELILHHNANIFAVNEDGKTPFDAACSGGFMFIRDIFIRDSILDCFLETYGKRLTQNHGRLALHVLLWSAEYSFNENGFHPPLNQLLRIRVPLGYLTLKHFCTLLLSLDAELIRNQDQSGKLPIHIAGRANAPVEVLTGLVQLDSATLQIANHSGALPIHECCSGVVEYSCVRYLVEQGGVGTLAARNQQGALPLHTLCGSTNPPLRALQFLIKSFPGSVRARTNTGQYPVMRAACNTSTVSLSVVYELVRACPELLTVPR